MRVQGVQGQGCPQHESTQPGPLTLLPHKTRLGIKTGTGPNSQQNEFIWVRGGQRVQGIPGGSRRSRGVQEEEVQGVLGGFEGNYNTKVDKRPGAVCQAYYAAASRIVCRRFQ